MTHNPGSPRAVATGCKCDGPINDYGNGTYLTDGPGFIVHPNCSWHGPLSTWQQIHDNMQQDGYWWVEGSTLGPYIVRVDRSHVFMWGDSTWYKQEQFVFLGKVKEHDNGTTASS